MNDYLIINDLCSAPTAAFQIGRVPSQLGRGPRSDGIYSNTLWNKLYYFWYVAAKQSRVDVEFITEIGIVCLYLAPQVNTITNRVITKVGLSFRNQLETGSVAWGSLG